MGLIREPDGVDFVIQSQPLTPTDVAEIQNWIRKQTKTSKTKAALPSKVTKPGKSKRENKTVRSRKVG